ncbi:MAG: hypothetical protein V7634_4887 [Bradyrhizobium sp.]
MTGPILLRGREQLRLGLLLFGDALADRLGRSVGNCDVLQQGLGRAVIRASLVSPIVLGSIRRIAAQAALHVLDRAHGVGNAVAVVQQCPQPRARVSECVGRLGWRRG